MLVVVVVHFRVVARVDGVLGDAAAVQAGVVRLSLLPLDIGCNL